jgi:hypothetical protein
MVYNKQAIGIGVVTRAYPHKEKGDTGHYQCDVRLVDSEQFLASVPVASQRVGMVCTPQEKDLVLVAFVGGDLYTPVILGTLYSNKTDPPPYQEGEIVYVCPPAQKSQPPSRELKRFHVELPGGMKLTVREEDIHYEYKVGNDDRYTFDLKKEEGLKLVVNKTTSLAISKDGDITIAATDTKISIKKNGEIAIDAKQKVGVTTTANVELTSTAGDLKLSATNITLEGKAGVNLKAPKMEISADATAEIKSSGIMNIKGSMVNLN